MSQQSLNFVDSKTTLDKQYTLIAVNKHETLVPFRLPNGNWEGVLMINVTYKTGSGESITGSILMTEAVDMKGGADIMKAYMRSLGKNKFAEMLGDMKGSVDYQTLLKVKYHP